MVIDKRDGALRPYPDQSRWITIGILQSPQLPKHCSLKDSLGSKIEGRDCAARVLRPCSQLVPVGVLIVGRLPILTVCQTIPEFADGEVRTGVGHVELGDAWGVALDEVEAPAVEADVGLEPVEPVGELLLHGGIEMIDVRSGVVGGAGVEVAGAVGILGVVAADEGGAPVEAGVRGAAFEDAVDSSAVFSFGSPVVNHDVGHGFHAVVVYRLD